MSRNLDISAKLLAPRAGDIVQVNLIDGLRLAFANGEIVHLRFSGNAPELRCYTEPVTEAKAKLLCESALKYTFSLQKRYSKVRSY